MVLTNISLHKKRREISSPQNGMPQKAGRAAAAILIESIRSTETLKKLEDL